MSKILQFESPPHKDLVFVILKCPYTTYKDSELTRKLFEKTVCLKYEGYFSKHDIGVQPVDGTDFLADHLLICENKNDDLTPLLGSKTLPLDVCPPNNIDWTIETFLRKENHEEHLCYLQEQMKRIEKKKKRISYHSSWTNHPKPQNDKETRNILKEMFPAITYHHHKEDNIQELLGLGVPQYKTHRYFYKWGYKPAHKDGRELEPVNFRVLNNIPGIFMHLQEWSPYAKEMADKYHALWDNRIIIGESDREMRKKVNRIA